MEIKEDQPQTKSQHPKPDRTQPIALTSKEAIDQAEQRLRESGQQIKPMPSIGINQG